MDGTVAVYEPVAGVGGLIVTGYVNVVLVTGVTLTGPLNAAYCDPAIVTV